MSKTDRPHKKVRIRLIVTSVILLLAGLPGYVIWTLLPHAYDPAGASTSADVTYYTSVPPPPEATNFRVAAYRFQNLRLVFVRFSAPPDVCRKYAQAVMPNTALASLNYDQKSLDLGAISMASNCLHDMRWFDLPYAQANWILQSGQSAFRKSSDWTIADYPNIVGADADTPPLYATTSVRVDISHGLFYFLRQN